MTDDFSEQVKRALASRVGNLCSNPECRALTSGPQDDPAKAVNLGVAAHITAASPGGPRFNPELLSEERCAPSNGIWLCQNCAKLVDNDTVRFPVGVLSMWKTTAEAEARARVGKTTIVANATAIHLRIGDLVRIVPIVPRVHEQTLFELRQKNDACFNFYKRDSQRQVDIPTTFIERAHRFGDSNPGLVELRGRLQWVSVRNTFQIFTDRPSLEPHGEFGVSKDTSPAYAARLGVGGSFAREDRIPELLQGGWHIFYDEDGKYLRWRGQGVDQIFVVNWV
jgi:hypothetical protein